MNAAIAHQHVHIAEQINNEKAHYANVRKAPTHKKVFGKLLDKLSIHYDIDMHKLVRL